MAAKIDTQAQKQRRQKIMLAVGGVLLIGLGLLQGPKLMNQGGTPAADSAAPAAASSTDSVAPAASGSAAGTAAALATATPVAVTGPTAVVAGVSVTAAGLPRAVEGQLTSFSRFASKDPFVQQAVEGQGASASGQPTLSDTQPNGSPQSAPAQADGKKAAASSTTAADGGGGATSEASPNTRTHATISVNGKSERLELEELFPALEKSFVLVSLKPRSARIGVAGGSFANGKTALLEMGKTLTLVDTATGARYVLRLLYTGTAEEQVQGFSKGKK